MTNKITIFLLGALAFVWALKNMSEKEPVNEIIIDGVPVSKGPCISATNELYGRSVDSLKVCDCMIAKFYELIKDDSLHLQLFKEKGIHQLEGAANDSLILLYRNCALENLIDTTVKLHLSHELRIKFKQKLQEKFDSFTPRKNLNTESLCDCVIDSLNDNITVKEYLADDYLEIDKVKIIVNACAAKTMK